MAAQHNPSLGLAFEALNLRFNPFGQLPSEELAQVAVSDLPLAELGEQLSQGVIIQFLAKSGRGKSTHLHHLRSLFPEAPYYYYPECGPKPVLGDAPLMFLDETQRLSLVERLKLWRSGKNFVIATHLNHVWEFKACGRRFLSVRLRGLTVDKLREVVRGRLEHARRTPGPLPYLSDDDLKKLITRYGDNLYAIENELYEVFQQQKELSRVTLRF
ncbi:MAG: hypothetical protein R2880_19875 [Deinococcales bacterium]